MEPTTTSETTTPAEKPANGPVVALLIILLLIVAGAAYVWMNEKAATQEDNAATLEMQSESTEPAAIESDLNAESPEEFSEDFDAAFTELDAAFEAE